MVSCKPHLLHVGSGHSLVALAAAPVGLHGRRLHWGGLRLRGRSAIVVVVVWHSTESRVQGAAGRVHALPIQTILTRLTKSLQRNALADKSAQGKDWGGRGPTIIVIDSSGSAACDSAACSRAACIVVVCTERASRSSRHRDNAHGCKPRSRSRPKRLAHCPFKKVLALPSTSNSGVLKVVQNNALHIVLSCSCL